MAVRPVPDPVPGGLRGRITARGLTLFARLPVRVRRALVRAGTPSFTVGCVAVIRHGDLVLLLRQRHRPGWTLPGGLLRRGERPEDCVRREVREEVTLTLPAGGTEPRVVVDTRARRGDLVYLFELDSTPTLPAGDAEVVEAQWRRADAPELAETTRRALRVAAGGQ